MNVWELEAALEHNQAETALRLYRGKFAPGMDISYINETQDHLHEKVIACLERHVRIVTADQAKTYCERILKLEPLSENAMSVLLEILVKSGRKPSAKKRLKAFKDRYKNEMGFEPMLETQTVLG